MHRQQNEYAESVVQKRVEKVKQERRELAERRSVTIFRTVPVSAEAHSLRCFYRDYAINSGITLLNILPNFDARGSPRCFQEALQAVALASSARQQYQSGLMVRAWQHYGKAIAALNIALSDPVLILDDSLLVTLFLFSLFELMRLFINYEPCTAMWSALEQFTMPWTNGPILEPLLRRAVDFKIRVRAKTTAMSHHLSREEAIQLIKNGIDISRDLEAAAINVNSSSNSDLPSDQQPTAFNNMFATSTKTTEAIASALYRTVRFYIIELVSGVLAIVGEKDDGTSSAFEPQFELPKGAIVLEQICEEISIVFGFDGKHEIQEKPTGMAYRAFGMFWPMAIVLFSSFVEEAKREWVKDKLQYVGEITGYGLATLAVRTANMPSLL
ncbi:hypothetical protein FDECE_7385 [Fusarium decemcellulare]|nr:hypothetical protein FDECE_7385 [Fusarium decemcellulare]